MNPFPAPQARERIHSGLGLNFIQPQARGTGARLLKSLRRFPGAIGLAEMIFRRRRRRLLWENPFALAKPARMIEMEGWPPSIPLGELPFGLPAMKDEALRLSL